MRKQKKIRKEDIGDPSNFVHVEHVGFGGKKSSFVNLHNQRSFDLGENRNNGGDISGSVSPAIVTTCENDEVNVERRSRGSRSSLIPRHHRSTTTCIFPENAHLQHHTSSPSPAFASRRDTLSPSPDKGLLNSKPTFGSLLNLSFLPLGLGKSSQSSGNKGGQTMGKTKRLSLLNLTASNLFTSNPKGNQGDEPKEAVQMTGYTRRRSFSNSRGQEGSQEEENQRSGTLRKQHKENKNNNEGTLKRLPPKSPPKENSIKPPSSPSHTDAVPSTSNSSRIPLAKLGRSKSSMSEFTKRPKLRLKIVPPVAPPPPIPKPPRRSQLIPEKSVEDENLPSPPPSPLPSPPKTPTSAPPLPPPPPTLEEELLAESKVILRKIPKSPPRSRIIPLPSTPSMDSLDFSPQYLTPAGGSSPMPQSLGENVSAFPLLSSTLPPSSTPLFPISPRHPATPPVWPLQPLWPTTVPVSLPQTEPTIPEVPSPTKEEMDIAENEYNPVASLVDSFLTNDDKPSNDVFENASCSNRVNRNNFEEVSSAFVSNLTISEFPHIIQRLFQLMQIQPNSGNTDHVQSIQKDVLRKSLELWLEVNNGEASLDDLTNLLKIQK